MDEGDHLGLAGVANSGVLEALAVLPCVAPSMGAVGQENTECIRELHKELGVNMGSGFQAVQPGD